MRSPTLPMSGQAWPRCDADVAEFLEGTVAVTHRALGADLVGIYLHGSLAMGCYYRPKSDLDLLVVTAALDPGRRRALAQAIACHAQTRPTTGNLELSAITAPVAAQVPVPVPLEVHYSSQWHEHILAGDVDWSATRWDPDLPAHLLSVRQRGAVLHGPPIADVVGQVPWSAFRAAVLDDFAWIVDGDNVLTTPFYGVLNICRYWHLLTTDEQVVLSKEEGAMWALEHLPAEHHRVVFDALEAYRWAAPVTDEERPTAGRHWDEQALRALVGEARTLLPRDILGPDTAAVHD